MEIKIIIDKERAEEIIIYAKEKTELIEEIENIVLQNSKELYGFKDRTAHRLSPSDIYCFIVESNKIYAITTNDKFLIKYRLYQLEKMMGEDFVKINQSCLANIKKIKRFDTSVSANMKVTFKNNYTDYVSRRCVKNVKERLGLR